MHGQGLAANPRANRRRYSSNRRRANPTLGGMIANPTYSNLFENPMGPYSAASLKQFGVATAGLAVGLAFARATDRYVATMKPADSKSGNKANRAWFGRAAAAAINRRPTILRLGVQAGGAVLAIGGAYALRNRALMPWLLGGIALGFGSNLFLSFIEWWVIPYLMKRKDPGELTMANRLYALEQIDDQDKVDAAFLDWQTIPALNSAQDQNAPVITSPLGLPASISVLGRPGRQQHAMVGAPRRFIADGRIGHCNTCGGDGGHYSGCSDCEICNGGGGGRKCGYTVQAGGPDIYAVANASGVTVSEISAMNGGGTPDSFWVVGREVILPEAACNIVLKQGGIPTSNPLIPTTNVPGTSMLVPNQPPPPPAFNPLTYQATGPNVPASSLRTAVVAGTPNGVPENVATNYAISGGGE